MHVNNGRNDKGGFNPNRTRMIAALSVFSAISVILLVLGTLISVNTVFFTTIAAFIVGMAVVNFGFGAGAMMFVGCMVLDFILNPDKFHVFLYMATGGFILLGEGSYKLLEKKIADPKKRNLIHLICRVIVFMAGYIPIAVFIPRLFITQDAYDQFMNEPWFTWALIGVGIIGFVVFDLAYLFVKRVYMKNFRL